MLRHSIGLVFIWTALVTAAGDSVAMTTSNKQVLDIESVLTTVGATFVCCVIVCGVCCCQQHRKTRHHGDVEAAKSAVSIEMTTLRSSSTDRVPASATVDDVTEAGTHCEPITIKLVGGSSSGLGFNVCGDYETGAIFVRELLSDGPAKQSGKIHPGDRLLSLKVSTECIELEDALTILSYASPYPVELCVQPATESFRTSSQLVRMSSSAVADTTARRVVRRAQTTVQRSRSMDRLDETSPNDVTTADPTKRKRKMPRRSQSEMSGRGDDDAVVVRLDVEHGVAALSRHHDRRVPDGARTMVTSDSAIDLVADMSTAEQSPSDVNYTHCELHAVADESYLRDNEEPTVRVHTVSRKNKKHRRPDDRIVSATSVNDDSVCSMTLEDDTFQCDSENNTVSTTSSNLRRSAVGRKPVHSVSASDDDNSPTKTLSRSLQQSIDDPETPKSSRHNMNCSPRGPVGEASQQDDIDVPLKTSSLSRPVEQLRTDVTPSAADTAHSTTSLQIHSSLSASRDPTERKSRISDREVSLGFVSARPKLVRQTATTSVEDNSTVTTSKVDNELTGSANDITGSASVRSVPTLPLNDVIGGDFYDIDLNDYRTDDVTMVPRQEVRRSSMASPSVGFKASKTSTDLSSRLKMFWAAGSLDRRSHKSKIQQQVVSTPSAQQRKQLPLSKLADISDVMPSGSGKQDIAYVVARNRANIRPRDNNAGIKQSPIEIECDKKDAGSSVRHGLTETMLPGLTTIEQNKSRADVDINETFGELIGVTAATETLSNTEIRIASCNTAITCANCCVENDVETLNSAPLIDVAIPLSSTQAPLCDVITSSRSIEPVSTARNNALSAAGAKTPLVAIELSSDVIECENGKLMRANYEDVLTASPQHDALCDTVDVPLEHQHDFVDQLVMSDDTADCLTTQGLSVLTVDCEDNETGKDEADKDEDDDNGTVTPNQYKRDRNNTVEGVEVEDKGEDGGSDSCEKYQHDLDNGEEEGGGNGEEGKGEDVEGKNYRLSLLPLDQLDEDEADRDKEEEVKDEDDETVAIDRDNGQEGEDNGEEGGIDTRELDQDNGHEDDAEREDDEIATFDRNNEEEEEREKDNEVLDKDESLYDESTGIDLHHNAMHNSKSQRTKNNVESVDQIESVCRAECFTRFEFSEDGELSSNQSDKNLLTVDRMMDELTETGSSSVLVAEAGRFIRTATPSDGDVLTHSAAATEHVTTTGCDDDNDDDMKRSAMQEADEYRARAADEETRKMTAGNKNPITAETAVTVGVDAVVTLACSQPAYIVTSTADDVIMTSVLYDDDVTSSDDDQQAAFGRYENNAEIARDDIGVVMTTGFLDESAECDGNAEILFDIEPAADTGSSSVLCNDRQQQSQLLLDLKPEADPVPEVKSRRSLIELLQDLFGLNQTTGPDMTSSTVARDDVISSSVDRDGVDLNSLNATAIPVGNVEPNTRIFDDHCDAVGGGEYHKCVDEKELSIVEPDSELQQSRSINGEVMEEPLEHDLNASICREVLDDDRLSTAGKNEDVECSQTIPVDESNIAELALQLTPVQVRHIESLLQTAVDNQLTLVLPSGASDVIRHHDDVTADENNNSEMSSFDMPSLSRVAYDVTVPSCSDHVTSSDASDKKTHHPETDDEYSRRDDLVRLYSLDPIDLAQLGLASADSGDTAALERDATPMTSSSRSPPMKVSELVVRLQHDGPTRATSSGDTKQRRRQRRRRIVCISHQTPPLSQ